MAQISLFTPGVFRGVITTPSGVSYSVQPGQTINADQSDEAFLLKFGFTPAAPTVGIGSGNVTGTGPTTISHLAIWLDTGGTKIGDGGAVPSASSLSINDGTHTVAAVATLSITGATVGGTTPNATLAINSSAGVYSQTRVTFSAADILALNTSPKPIIPAPSAGKYLQVVSFSASSTGGTTGYTLSQNIQLVYGTTGQYAVNGISDSFTTANNTQTIIPEAISNDNSLFEALGLFLFAPTTDPIGGDLTGSVTVGFLTIDL